jgi:hypothetical protein
MALRYAVSTGNWSSPATWDGGITIPGAGDVVRPNNFTVTIDQDITIEELRNDAGGSAAANGNFILTGDFTISVGISIQCFATNLLTYNGVGQASIIGAFNGASIISSETTNYTAVVTHAGTGHLTVSMSMSSGVANEIQRFSIAVTQGGTLTCLKAISKTVNVDSGRASVIDVSTVSGATLNLRDIEATNRGIYMVYCSVHTTIVVNGDLKGIIPGVGAAANHGGNIYCASSSKITVNGNLFGGNSGNNGNINHTIGCIGTTQMVINGNITGQLITGTHNQVTNTVHIAGANSTVSIVGNLTGNSTTGSSGISKHALYIANTATNSLITVIGNLYGGVCNAGGGSHDVIRIDSTSSVLNITGDIIAGSGTSRPYGIGVNAGTVNITGSILGGSDFGMVCTGGAVNVIGTLQASTTSPSVSLSGTGNINHIGSVIAGVSAAGIISSNPGSTSLICTGPFVNNNYTLALSVSTLKINAAFNPYFQFRKSDGTVNTYIPNDNSLYPTPGNVRQGINYNISSVGTLAVPTADKVALGTPVDDTIGTAIVTAEDFLNEIAISSHTLAERLRNVSTVQTTGAQLDAFN